MGMHCHPKHRLASPQQEAPMGSVLHAADNFSWSNCVMGCRVLGNFVGLGDIPSLEDVGLKEQGSSIRAMCLNLSSELVSPVGG